MKNQKTNGFRWLSKNKIMVLVLIIILISFLPVVWNLVNNNRILEKREIYARIGVDNVFGVEANWTALRFGIIPPGNIASKEITLDNKYGHDVRARIFVTGNITDFVAISANDFVLKAGESKIINFVAFIPKETKYGTYEGKVYIIFYKK
jgi:hypothetical protein